MNKVIIDLEFTKINDCSATQKKKCGCETIQIGAVKLDENNKMIGDFNTYVKPEYTSIQSKVTELTHISDDTVKDAPAFSEALDSFLTWIGDGETIIYSWSETDKMQFKKESKLKDCRSEKLNKLFKNWIDLQLIVGNLLGIKQQLSLKNVLNGTGIRFEGREHSALSDAFNTAKLFKLTQNEDKFREQAKSVLELVEPTEPLTFTMGDLLSGLVFE